MDADATAMASGNLPLYSREYCATCYTLGYSAPRMWKCDACQDYFLCENCYKGSLADGEVPSASSQVHNRDHLMSMLPHRKKWLCGSITSKTHLTKISSASHMDIVEEDASTQTSPKTHDDSGHISQLQKNISLKYKSLSPKHSLETPSTQRVFDTRHKIFLSHAGAQKFFVEELHQELLKVHHFGTFFDKDDGSLPKGESFPHKIFNAAQHCELAIVVISTDYFTRKWPMLELATFVKEQKRRPELKILPIFYKLSVEEFKQSKRQQSYVRSWKQMSLVSKDDIQLWKEALKVISRTTGIEFDKNMGKMALRKQIVETVCKRVKHEIFWDDSDVQGKASMHEMIEEKFSKLNNAAGEVQSTFSTYVGLYGVGGSGKTTMSKVFCNKMMQHYSGRSCHIELGTMDSLQLRKTLLKCINCYDSSFLNDVADEDKALKLLKDHIFKYKICLVIDNVSDIQASLEEARILLNLPFKEGSSILVTSRSKYILKKLNIKTLMKVPALSTNEAMALFVHHTGCGTSSLSEDQRRAMETFVEQCCFKTEGMTRLEYRYHPLALKVLGTRVGSDPEKWCDIEIDFKSSENENIHHIFSILRSSYDALIPRYQRMFLDLALSTSDYIDGISNYDMEWQMRCLYGEKNKGKKRFIPKLVEDLQAKSLIESHDVDYGRIYIHDLYYEFAIMEVEKNGLQHSPICCLSRAANRQRAVQARRLRIQNQLILQVTRDILSCTICSEAELFSIQGCPNLKCIDVPGMQNLKMFEVTRGCPQLRSVNLEGAVSLQCLSWEGFLGEYPDLTSLESLEGLWLLSAEVMSPPPLQGSLDFSRSSNLDTLHLSYLPLNLLNLNQVVKLRILRVNDCQYLERFEGLEALVNLGTLELNLCSSLLEFPSLINFPSLEIFHLQGAAKLNELLGFANLTALLRLSLSGGKELEKLPGIEACTRLSSLDLSNTNLEVFSWVSELKDLVVINLSSTKIRFVPECSELSKLSQLWLKNCQVLESLGNNMRIRPTLSRNLQVLSARYSGSLKAIPQFNYESAIYYLDIGGTSVEEISGVMNCKHLQYLYCAETRITSLPDLSSLTRLKILDVSGCGRLTRMDNIKSLPALEELLVSDCTSLLTLPDLGSSKGLTSLSLVNCPLVNPNSVKLPTESTVHMEMENAADEQSDSDVERLEGENQALAVMDSQEPQLALFPRSLTAFLKLLTPEPAQFLWRSASFLRLLTFLSSILAWWFVRKLGKRRLTFQHEVERR